MKNKLLLITSLILLNSCNNTTKSLNEIPNKVNVTDNDVLSCPINSSNLDDYMFRDDVQYVDLRSVNMVLTEGYVSGFSFIPFYNIIGSFNSNKTLYKMEATQVGNTTLAPGQVGSFKANYVESEEQLKSYFSESKYIFFLSQGGSEGSYMINLLSQIGYDCSKLYNVGGVSNNEGRLPYKEIENNKYYIEPGVNDIKISFDFSFLDTLTPITKEEK